MYLQSKSGSTILYSNRFDRKEVFECQFFNDEPFPILPLDLSSNLFKDAKFSVTKFGEIPPLWQNFKTLWQLFKVLVSVGQIFGTHFGKSFILLGKFSLF